MIAKEAVQAKVHGLREILYFDNWASLIFQRFFSRPQFENYRYHGVDYLIDRHAGDLNSVRYCLTTNEYNATYEYVREQKWPKLSLLDIGANAGGFALRCFHEGLNVSRVVAVEFHPETYHRLALNLHQAYGRTATALNVALAASEGMIEVGISAGSTGESIYREKNSSNTVSICTQSFDSLANSHFPDQSIDLCKMDVEGAEYEAILEGKCTRLADVKVLTIEIHPHRKHSRDQLLERLRSFGLKPVANLTHQVVLLANVDS